MCRNTHLCANLLRTRGARSGFRVNRTLRSHGDANDGSLRERYTFRTAVLKVLRKCPTLSHLGALAPLASKTKNLPIFRVSPPTPSRFEKKERFFGFGSAFRLSESFVQAPST